MAAISCARIAWLLPLAPDKGPAPVLWAHHCPRLAARRPARVIECTWCHDLLKQLEGRLQTQGRQEMLL